MQTLTRLPNCTDYIVAPSIEPHPADEDGAFRYKLVVIVHHGAAVASPGNIRIDSSVESAPKPPRVPRDDAAGAVWGVTGLAAFALMTGSLMALGAATLVAWLLNLVRSVLGG